MTASILRKMKLSILEKKMVSYDNGVFFNSGMSQDMTAEWF